MSLQCPEASFANVALIIVNYGTADLTIEAVQSVLAQDHGGRAVDIYVVDNASPGNDAAILRDACAAEGWDGRVTLWLETKNHGFGRGNNVVLKTLAQGQTVPDAVFLLNPDARLINNAVGILAATLEANPEAAAAGTALQHPDGTPIAAAYRFPGLLNEIARMANLSLLHRLWQHHQVPLPPDHPAGPVDWVSGAAVMIRFDAMQDLGFFDPGFFLYYEEVDLMRRLRGAGWGILYEPRALVSHEVGAATGQFTGVSEWLRVPPYLYQSWAHYFSRAYGRGGALGITFMMWPAALVNMIHRGLRGRTPTVPKYYFRDTLRYVVWPVLTGRTGS